MNYQETLDWMFSQLPVFQRIGKAAYKANLDNTYAIMALLDQPQLKFKSIHIAGTNGKGSTAHMLASIYQEAGYKTGLYTSPHLRDFRERIRINGKMIPKQKVMEFVNGNKDTFQIMKPSFFEMTVGMAFKYFADEQVDIAIIETGLGGRLDSTNILKPEISLITNIGMDHMQFLGNTIPEIAKEKAGIIKKNIPVIIGEHQNETDIVFIEMAKSMEAPIQFAEDSFTAHRNGDSICIKRNGKIYLDDLSIPLKGNYQLKNIVTVVSAAHSLKLSLLHIKAGLQNVIENTAFAGRWQILKEHPLTICDTAHNYEGLSWVMKQLNEMKNENLHIVLGVVDDKQLVELLRFFPNKATYYFCKADIPRGLSAEILAKQAKKQGLNGAVFSSVNKALQAAQLVAKPNDLVFVGGSTFTVAEVV
ncbi:MAG: bifunctional folylpolyglutamate synthase/dihydrofolate synthase [Bacteroidales bacterium]|nr:bifunctional folylpolyglutamate synthase/dihydrofolate synthase [Bacteroidales bacterium]